MAAGKPVIASLDGEGARIILEAGAGVAVPAEDATALAAAVRFLNCSSKNDLERMGANARGYYEANFEPRLLASRLKQYLLGARKTA